MNAKRLTLDDLVLENRARPAGLQLTAEQLAPIARARGVKCRGPESIHEAESRLRRAGRLASSERQVTRAALPMPDGAPLDRAPRSPEALLAVLERGDILGRPERLRLASHLARTAPGPVQVAALKHLDEADPHPPATVGPGVPLTDAERVNRLAAIMIACGRSLSLEALGIAEQSLAWTTPNESTALTPIATVVEVAVERPSESEPVN